MDIIRTKPRLPQNRKRKDMSEKQLYRIINPIEERIGEEVDAVSRPLSPRIYKTKELSPVFNLIVDFWREEEVQLATAVQAIVLLPSYFDKLNIALEQHKELFELRYVNSKESKPLVETETIRNLAIRYLQCGIKMNPDEGCYIWEYLWELVRQAQYPNCTSRYNCLFAFENRADAEKYLKERIKENPSHAIDKICHVEIKHIEKQEVYDMRWLDEIEIFAKYNEYMQAAGNYWSGKMTPNPLKEVLFQGIYSLQNI